MFEQILHVTYDILLPLIKGSRGKFKHPDPNDFSFGSVVICLYRGHTQLTGVKPKPAAAIERAVI